MQSMTDEPAETVSWVTCAHCGMS